MTETDKADFLNKKVHRGSVTYLQSMVLNLVLYKTTVQDRNVNHSFWRQVSNQLHLMSRPKMFLSLITIGLCRLCDLILLQQKLQMKVTASLTGVSVGNEIKNGSSSFRN